MFRNSPKCPNCGEALSEKPIRKTSCPHCGETIRVRKGRLITEEQFRRHDWLDRLEYLGVTENQLDREHEMLSRKFGYNAAVYDTVWRILNSLVSKYARDQAKLAKVYREMAALASKEGKDPTPYLEQAAGAEGNQHSTVDQVPEHDLFLGHDELAYVRELRAEGDFEKAEELLMRAEPSPAVLDEIRKLSSARAKLAKKDGDWQGVLRHLISYEEYADQVRDKSIKMTNQEPPQHTATDKRLMEEARLKLG